MAGAVVVKAVDVLSGPCSPWYKLGTSLGSVSS